MLRDQQVFHDRHLAKKTDVLKRARQPGTVDQVGSAEHFVEKTLPELRGVNPVAGLEFLPEDLNNIGRFMAGIKQNVAAGGSVEPRQAVKHGCFSRPVGANQGGNGAALHVQVDVV